MEGDSNFSLVRRTPGGVERTRPGVKRIVEGMVGDTLELAREKPAPLAERRFRIGDHELCEPDYRQILWWAEAMHLSGEEVIQRLLRDHTEAFAASKCYPLNYVRSSVIEGGRLRHLVWDSQVLPLAEFHWEPDLKITYAAFLGLRDWRPSLQLRLATLLELCCVRIGLSQLDLSRTPLLTKFDCGGNLLTELDLTPVPQLRELHCGGNQLTELDLIPVPELTLLRCDFNQLTELDLTSVPALTWLNCSLNQLTELDLTSVPELTWLACSSNQLTELDLTPVPKLSELYCHHNQLTELDLTPVPELTLLRCDSNQLTELDLASVPALTWLACSSNQLTEVDLTLVPECQNSLEMSPV